MLKPDLAFLIDRRINRPLVTPGILLAEDPSPAPTPSLEERVSDLEQRIQSIEHIPVVAFALKLRGSTEQNAATTPATTPQSDSPLELVGWDYRFKEGQQSYENRHVFNYVLKNTSKKPIKLIHGTLLFTDLLGEKIVAIKLNPDVEYPQVKLFRLAVSGTLVLSTLAKDAWQQ